ncbi:MAG TPA: hypothetical protein VH351_00310 [Bryobacteraceae bacterium]|nr:hypothetical protein [Bryobacteraceae bacterium]
MTKRPETFMKYVKLLLSGISSTAVEADTRPAFQHQVNTISSDLSDQVEDETLSGQLASVIKLLDEYNRAAEHKTEAQQRELRGIITATTDTIAAISLSSKNRRGANAIARE